MATSEIIETGNIVSKDVETGEIANEDIESAEQLQATISTSLIVCLIILIYIALMMITGGTVYAAHGWQGRGSGPDSTLVSKTIGMILTVIDILKGENTTFFDESISLNIIETEFVDSNNVTVVITGVCPVDGVCPPSSGCVENKTSCIPQPKRPCIPQVWPTRHICWQPTTPCPFGTCQLRECPTPATQPPIEDFRTAFIDTKPVIFWLNMYPPNSANRLEVITTLLTNSIEHFSIYGYFHRCRDRWTEYDEAMYKTICSFCNDRYRYIRCVMTNNLIGQVNTINPQDNYLKPIWWGEFSFMHTDMVNMVYHGVPYTHFDYIFERFEKMKQALAVQTSRGGKCEICTDYKRSVYDRCFSAEGKYYVYPQNRT